MSFLKYFVIVKNTLQEYFVYRVNFVFWRLQVFVSFVIFYSLWSAVGHSRGYVGIYSLSQLVTYFVIGYVIRALVFTTRTADIGGDIQQGNLSSLLLKPISTIKYYLSRDLIDKLFNLFFMIIEFVLLLILFKPQISTPSLLNIFIFIIFVALSIAIFFFYSLTISFITFWADNAWSSRFLFGYVFVNLFSGQFIPLDLLPNSVSQILKYTPYPYMFFYPVKIWLGQITPDQAGYYLISGLANLLFICLLSQFMWQRGIRRYQSYGN